MKCKRLEGKQRGSVGGRALNGLPSFCAAGLLLLGCQGVRESEPVARGNADGAESPAVPLAAVPLAAVPLAAVPLPSVVSPGAVAAASGGGMANSPSAPQAVLSPSALAQLELVARKKRELSSAERKLSTGLLLEATRGDADALLGALPELRSRVPLLPEGRVLVDVRARVTEKLLRRVRELGGDVVVDTTHSKGLQAKLPVAALAALAAEPAVSFVRPALGSMTHAIDVSEGNVAHRADVVRSSVGVDGSGITIGVISDGVESLAAMQGSDDLPANVQVLAGQAGEGDEGTAMLEIVHDLAPGAALFFATAGDSEEVMAQNIGRLRDAGCDIIVDDVYFFSEATFQDDVVAQAVSEVVSDGAFYFSSAGNSGNQVHDTSGTYEGDFEAVPLPQAIIDFPEDVWQAAHAFGAGNANTLTFDPPVMVTLEWSDPLGGSGNDYDLFMVSSDGADVLALSADPQAGVGDPLEAIASDVEDDTGNLLVVARWSGDARYLRLVTHRGELAVSTGGQISGHAAAAEALAIAAVDATDPGGVFVGGATNPVEWFSSDGPRRMFYNAAGVPFTPGNVSASGGQLRNKPDFAAADGVSVATPTFSPFFGTSAAAPHAAALAALVLEARPDIPALPAAQRLPALRAAFAATALDIEAPGFDMAAGAGLIMADAAHPCAGRPNGTACDDGDGCTQTDECDDSACVGADPVVCPAEDSCFEASVCDSGDGSCSQQVPKVGAPGCGEGGAPNGGAGAAGQAGASSGGGGATSGSSGGGTGGRDVGLGGGGANGTGASGGGDVGVGGTDATSGAGGAVGGAGASGTGGSSAGAAGAPVGAAGSFAGIAGSSGIAGSAGADNGVGGKTGVAGQNSDPSGGGLAAQGGAETGPNTPVPGASSAPSPTSPVPNGEEPTSSGTAVSPPTSEETMTMDAADAGAGPANGADDDADCLCDLGRRGSPGAPAAAVLALAVLALSRRRRPQDPERKSSAQFQAY